MRGGTPPSLPPDRGVPSKPEGGVPVPPKAPPKVSPMNWAEYLRRRREGRETALKEGRVIFRPPFGYKVVGSKLVVDEPRRALLKGILEDFDKGMETGEIATKRGVSAHIIRRIRKNPIYRTGEVYYAGKLVYKVEAVAPRKEG